MSGGLSPRRRYAVLLGALAMLSLAAASLAACTSGGAAGPSTSAAPRTSPTPPPTTSSSSPSEPTSSAHRTTSSPAPTRSTKPLSGYENDPAVKAVRAWAAQFARTINSGHATDAALERLETPAFAKVVPTFDRTDVGRTFPGPVPFTPLGIKVDSPTQRRVDLCWLGAGYSTKAGKTEKRSVSPVVAITVLQNGRWLMSQFGTVTSFSCKHTPIKERSF